MPRRIVSAYKDPVTGHNILSGTFSIPSSSPPLAKADGPIPLHLRLLADPGLARHIVDAAAVRTVEGSDLRGLTHVLAAVLQLLARSWCPFETKCAGHLSHCHSLLEEV